MTVEVLVNYFKNRKFANRLSWKEQDELDLSSSPFTKRDFTIKLSGDKEIDDEWQEIAKKITRLDLSKTNLWNIDQYIFSLSPLKELQLPSCIKRIGIAGFLNARLKKLDLSNTDLDSVYSYTFYNSPLLELELPKRIKAIKRLAFFSAQVPLLDLTKYHELEQIRKYAFSSMDEWNFIGIEPFLEKTPSIIKTPTKILKSLKTYLNDLGVPESFLDKDVLNNKESNNKELNDDILSLFESVDTKPINGKISVAELTRNNSSYSTNIKKYEKSSIFNEPVLSIRKNDVHSLSNYLKTESNKRILDLSKIEDENIFKNKLLNEEVEADIIIFSDKKIKIPFGRKIILKDLNDSKFVNRENFETLMSRVNLDKVKEWKITNEIFGWLISEEYYYNPLENDQFLKPNIAYKDNLWSCFKLDVLDLSELNVTDWNYSMFLSGLKCKEIIMPNSLKKLGTNSLWMCSVDVLNMTNCDELELIEHNSFYRTNINEILLPDEQIVTIME